MLKYSNRIKNNRPIPILMSRRERREEAVKEAYKGVDKSSDKDNN